LDKAHKSFVQTSKRYGAVCLGIFLSWALCATLTIVIDSLFLFAQQQSITRLDATKISSPEIDTIVLRLTEQVHVTGAGIAIVNDGKVVYLELSLRIYLIGRDPVMRMSTSLLALCCQSGPDATWETPISARSRSNGSRSLRMSRLLMARFTNESIAP
jgi:hypothetical protein